MSRHQLLKRWGFWIAYFFLVLLFVSKPMAVGWDDSEYLANGKYIFGGIGYASWYRPPILPIILGFLWKLGFPMPFASLMFAKLIYLLIPLATYRLGGSKKYAGLLIAANPLFFKYSHLPLSHLIATLFLLLSFSSSGFVSGAFSALSGLSRFPFFIFMIASLLYGDKKSRFKGQLAVLLPYFLIATIVFGNPLHQFVYANKIIRGIFEWYWLKSPLFYFKLLVMFSPFAFLAVRKKNPATLAFVLSLLYFTLLPQKIERFFIDILVFAMLSLSEFPRLSLAQLAYYVPLLLITPVPNTTPAAIYKDIPNGASVFGVEPYVNSYKDVVFYEWFDFNMTERWDADYCIYSSEAFPCQDAECFSKRDAFRKNCSSWDVLTNRSDLIIARNPEAAISVQ